MNVPTESGKVLIVDDSPANLIALGAVLMPLGVKVVEARSGAEAIELIGRESFAVALLDVQMPDMDGFELAARLRRLPTGHELPIVFLTAIYHDERYAKRGYEIGGADYITKPFDADVLRARVKAFVDLFQQRERLRAQQVGERTRERDDALAELARLLEREQVARREAEVANRAKDEFLATMSHELRTPLNAILGWAVLARPISREPEVQRALATIERNARAQMRIIEDVLDVGRIISGKLRLELVEIDAVQPVKDAVEAVRPSADAKEVALRVDLAGDAGRMMADPERLQQVVWNVLSNAIKFTPRGGHVTLVARRDDAAVTVRVSDDGMGIAPELLPQIFEPFRQGDASATRRHGGLGLGLAIVKQLVQAHGGTVVAQSAGVGCGSTFTISLPARALPASSTRQRAAKRADEERLDGIDVVVVDDDEDSRELAAHLLSTRGATVRAAASAMEGLRLLDAKPPHVILSDLAMPEIDGFGFIQRVRARPPENGGHVPAIAITAHAPGPLTEGLLEAGFQAHVPKPIEPSQLASLVRSLAAKIAKS